MATLQDHDALVGHRYSIEIDGLTIANFREVTGLSVERPLIEQKVAIGKGETLTRKYPGNAKYGDITLKRGMSSSDEFYRWVQQVEGNEWAKALRSGSVVQFHAEIGEVNRWNFSDGWPSKWELSGQKADANEVLVETLTIKVGRLWKG